MRYTKYKPGYPRFVKLQKTSFHRDGLPGSGAKNTFEYVAIIMGLVSQEAIILNLTSHFALSELHGE